MPATWIPECCRIAASHEILDTAFGRRLSAQDIPAKVHCEHALGWGGLGVWTGYRVARQSEEDDLVISRRCAKTRAVSIRPHGRHDVSARRRRARAVWSLCGLLARPRG